MAESDKEDRTEEATGRRLQQAHDRGQIPRSRELNTAAMLVAASLALWAFGSHFAQGMARMMRASFRLSRDDAFYPEAMVRHFADAMWDMVRLFGPFLALTVLVALATPIGLGGWNFSTQTMEPKLSKINPWNGLKRIFGVQGLIELGKSALKVILIGTVSWLLLRHYWDAMLGLGDQPLASALARSTDILGFCMLVLSLSLGLIAAVDVPFQLWTHKRDLRMTKQEVRDEAKETEGSPQVKQKIRRMQMEIAMRRMMEEVPKADVIVTNPTHYAVALQYRQGGTAAPRVVAKGADLVAAQIRNAAIGAGVPLLSAPPLARALYHSTELDQEIPTGLYMAVAQVLAYVYQLHAVRQHGGSPPPEPRDLPIPPDLAHD